MTRIGIVQIVAAIAVVVGIILSFIEIKNRPHGLLLESSPKFQLSPWYGWLATAIGAILYAVLDFIKK
jgi:hypothetical protein